MCQASASEAEAEPPPVAAAPTLRHDLASPLTVIRCHAQLARLRLGDLPTGAAERDRLDAHLAAIEGALDRAVAMLYPEAATSPDGPVPGAGGGRLSDVG